MFKDFFANFKTAFQILLMLIIFHQKNENKLIKLHTGNNSLY